MTRRTRSRGPPAAGTAPAAHRISARAPSTARPGAAALCRCTAPPVLHSRPVPLVLHLHLHLLVPDRSSCTFST